MSPSRVLRAAVMAAALVVSVSGVAAADTVVADTVVVHGQSIAVDSQTSVSLGDVQPGATIELDVAFRLTCDGSSRVAAGSTIVVAVSSQGWPDDGHATVTPGSIDVPGTWPAPGAACTGVGLPTTPGTTPAHLVITAPTLIGNGDVFVFLFTASPSAGISGPIGFSVTMNVVPAAVGDTTPPTLIGMPGDVTVFTPGTGAVVAYAPPTASDDTDANPAVACEPPSGATFPLGTTAVTCTATDASGNVARAGFTVTVRQLAATWGRPLGDGVPALTGQLGRTIPLKLAITSGDVIQGPGDVQVPELVLQRLDSCGPTGLSLASRDGGAFAWGDGAWQLQLRTGDLGPGCWRLTATVDGTPLATAVISLSPAQSHAAGAATPRGPRID